SDRRREELRAREQRADAIAVSGLRAQHLEEVVDAPERTQRRQRAAPHGAVLRREAGLGETVVGCGARVAGAPGDPRGEPMERAARVVVTGGKDALARG